MLETNTKFFKLTEGIGSDNECYGLFVCHKDTPIPTMNEVIERYHLTPSLCEEDEVVEISKEEFLAYHNSLLACLADNAEIIKDWAPNLGGIATWEFWEAEEDL